jgi:hypothetical protein
MLGRMKKHNPDNDRIKGFLTDNFFNSIIMKKAISFSPDSQLKLMNLSFPLFGRLDGEIFVCEDGTFYHHSHFIYA